jgi:hypothetical protein
MTIKTVGFLSIMTLKTMPKFGNGDGNWSKMKDSLYFDSFIESKKFFWKNFDLNRSL